MSKQWNNYLQLVLFFYSCDVISGISADVPWPDGKYGLPKPNAGCPHTAGVTWESGWVQQDMVKESGYDHSEPLHLQSDLSKNIKRYFCMKTKSESTDKLLWPAGKYCIYRKGGSCPKHMTNGYYYWDDESVILNKNFQYGVYPDGKYSYNTRIYFCCRTDSEKSRVPISLPTSQPFFLLAQGSAECQQVKWALATAEWLTYDTAGEGNRGEVYPYNGWLGKDPTIYYCYYQSCNYTESGDRGNVTSPNYPGPLPHGQFCSWRITVVPDHQVNLKFDVFNLSGNELDEVEVFDGDNDTAPTLGLFTGNNAPPTLGVNSSSNTMFIILRSTSEPAAGTNSGIFRALFSKRGKTRQPTNSPTQSSSNPEHVTTVATEAVPTEHASGNSSAQGETGTRTGGGMVVVAVVVPLVMVLAAVAVTVFLLCRRRKKDKPSRKGVLSVTFNSTPHDSAAAVENPIYDTEIDAITRISPNLPKPSYEEIESDNPLYDTAETDRDNKQLCQRHEITCQAGPRLTSTSKNPHDLQPAEYLSKDKESENPLYDAAQPSCLVNPIYQW